MPNNDELTGRDSWIFAEALATAIVALEDLPARRQPSSNIEDMKIILASMTPSSSVALLMAQAKCRLRPDLDFRVIWRECGFVLDGDAGADA